MKPDYRDFDLELDRRREDDLDDDPEVRQEVREHLAEQHAEWRKRHEP